jgi:hypothetical protein
MPASLNTFDSNFIESTDKGNPQIWEREDDYIFMNT